MLNILSILKYVYDGISKKDPRYNIKNDEHVLDTKTGLTFHVYDNWFKIAREDTVIATKEDFSQEENMAIWHIKQLISDPKVIKHKQDNFAALQSERRQMFAKMYEEPTPIVDKSPAVEAGTTTYTG